MPKYDAQKIEKKWQKEWGKRGTNKTGEAAEKPKYYVLDMFPYPSGAGLHVGHPKGYIATDIVARYKMMQGFNVLHPMGWDAFGLPAENYAIKNKIHPSEATEKNIKTFKKQLGLLGFTYDWDREVNTTDPKYYKWTQWAFLQMFKKGLVYESYEPINWCPSCKTGLANEDLEGGLCERCGSSVERKPLRQWVIKITEYAERLLRDLEKLPEWEESIKEMQKNWIGKSEGALVSFKLKAGTKEENLEVFTTRPDTLFGATYLVLAPEHHLLHTLESEIKNLVEVKEYVMLAKNKTELERTDLAKEKTGVKLEGFSAINPVNGEELPVFTADYVLTGYGTGAIMAVPFHDERDWDFAQKFGLPVKQVVAPLFRTVSGPDAVQPDKSTVDRKVITAFVKHNKEDKYLCLDWLPYGWKTGIIGGVEDGEDVTEAAKREIREETGYKNLRFVKYVGGEMHNNFFARHKNVNRYARATGMLFELINEEKDMVDPEELVNHQPVWVAGKEMKNFLNLLNFVYMWEIMEGRNECFGGDGVAVNSDFLNGLETSRAKEEMIKWLEDKGLGVGKVQFKIRDWVFSRQRYWGEPIPLVRCEHHGWVPVPDEELPLELPKVKQYEPTGTGESPLANIKEWVNTICPQCGGPAIRETNTMPQWAGSCWYYLRYMDPHNAKALVNKEKEKYWSPVDLYVGGAEHATRHLIYARFWHKFLFDIGVVNYEEPFVKLQHVGLILAEDGRKMSKRWNNVINPDDVVEKYGADAMRLYEMFMGPFSQPCAWSTRGVVGMRRFLERFWNFFTIFNSKEKWMEDTDKDLRREIEKTIKKVADDIGELKFNTAISQLMILINLLKEDSLISRSDFGKIAQLLAPFAPHLAEEIWESLGNSSSIFESDWPEFDSSLARDETITLVVQVNGKLRDTLVVPADIKEEEARFEALKSEKMQKWLEGKTPKKVIFVPGKLVNIVI